MRIDSSAPARIDLAGSTLDIWPLYLRHRQAQTLNVAITIRAHCRLTSRSDRRVRLQSMDSGLDAEVADLDALPDEPSLRLVSCIARHFRAAGLDLVTRSDSPMGAGLAGSSALNVAVCAALARWRGEPLSAGALFRLARDLEAQTIAVPTGAQDYRPAYYGGVSAVELGPGEIRRVALKVEAKELERRIVLAYTGASRDSGVNNWEIVKRHVDGDPEVFSHFERIRDVAVAMRDGLATGDWARVGEQIAAEWQHRKQLVPTVTTPAIDRFVDLAHGAGALATKVCGAGGGGCIFSFAHPRDITAIGDRLSAAGARVLPWAVDHEGLRLRVEP